jgi:transposase-like protein
MGERRRKADGRRVFSTEFKRTTVQRILTGEKTLAELSRELDISPSVIRNWKRFAEAGATIAVQASEDVVPPASCEKRTRRSENSSARADIRREASAASLAWPGGDTAARPYRAGSVGPFAIQVQAARDLGDRHSLSDPQAANLLPPLPADHRPLPAESDLSADGCGRGRHFRRHIDALLLRRAGKFHLPQVGTFALPLTHRP